MRALLQATCLCGIATLAAAQGDAVDAVSGTFQPVNTVGETFTGSVSATPGDGDVVLRLDVEGAPPGMHLAHIHGFASADPEASACPDAAADTNGDGYVDLIETREQAGVTMIPFTDAPAGLQIESRNYPIAGEGGRMTYEQTVELAALQDEVEAAFDTPLALSQRVVFIHGAPEGTELPDSVQTLEGVPAAVTIPIACAELDAVEQ
ncbi:hypothetical protein [Citreimonas salinaria]|uniref:CHRD domain-containing protein n=1 Tax=Citreimonas salinaria TaxID=321339 RepID=A0A1H3NMX7_9RHOB|nr:hypothetical protein [Citreimonas salinaria]SDY90252.1 hypothetical protein SAMN05444340_12713 [Citreimonas salinaria]